MGRNNSTTELNARGIYHEFHKVINTNVKYVHVKYLYEKYYSVPNGPVLSSVLGALLPTLRSCVRNRLCTNVYLYMCAINKLLRYGKENIVRISVMCQMADVCQLYKSYVNMELILNPSAKEISSKTFIFSYHISFGKNMSCVL